jgi:putative pyoverdin transport system ATP-binding/permease protein
MRVIYFLMRYSRRSLVLAVLAGVISGAANTGLLTVINTTLHNQARKPQLAALFIVLCLLVPIARIASELLLTRLGQGVLFKLRMDLSRQILRVPLRRLEEVGPHRLLTALTEDIPAITNIVNLIPIVCINAAVAITCLIYMGWLSWPMLLAVLVALVLGIVTYQLPVVKGYRYWRLARKESDNLFNHFRALTEGIKELKIHGERRQAFLTDMLEATAKRYSGHNISGNAIYTVAASWGQLLVFVVVGLLLFVLSGWIQISATVMTGFTLTILYLMTPLQLIMNTIPTMGRAGVALKNVDELGLTLTASPSEEESPKALTAGRSSWTSLELRGVLHSYRREGEDSLFVLGPIDLTFRPGELVFLTGGNGSGKTTLAKLILGLYQPESGEILLNNKPVVNETTDFYRQHFSVVFSDFFLFNSLLGLDTENLDARARQYLSQLRLENKVQVTDGTLSTTDLSQGQRKRLALLTAYLEDRPIYVFDEWAADQDPFFKEIFYHQLLPELKARGKTIIAITHDDRYYDVGDRTIKLDDGKIVHDQPVTFSEVLTKVSTAPMA